MIELARLSRSGMRSALIIVLVTVLLGTARGPVLTGNVVAQRDSNYELTWSTLDAGGSTGSTSGDYALSGTIGQPDAGLALGGGYLLAGGFWSLGAISFAVYLPVVLR